MNPMPMRTLLCGLWLSGAVAVSAQTLSSPLPPGTPPPSGAVLPGGQGAGVHSPLSPFVPLPKRTDVVAWSTLTDVTTRVEKKRIVPVYPAPVAALHQKTLRLQGFMMPLEPGENQRHFLLTSVPLSCAFCTPGGPESMVEVKTKTPVKATMEPVVVEGRFLVLADDPQPACDVSKSEAP